MIHGYLQVSSREFKELSKGIYKVYLNGKLLYIEDQRIPTLTQLYCLDFDFAYLEVSYWETLYEREVTSFTLSRQSKSIKFKLDTRMRENMDAHH